MRVAVSSFAGLTFHVVCAVGVLAPDEVQNYYQYQTVSCCRCEGRTSDHEAKTHVVVCFADATSIPLIHQYGAVYFFE